ncbi:Hcy-binding domain-containing protein [Caenorhabditis elegans]|uniref:Hcy-binding domain-containing protein n=1 Tax=Caenorhabditis elegans TaxID=6239 RepID=Q966F6_CAEEL|nr:Hcy-binding domain-containing protein [Caenorhabditis elegans]CCD67540.1 Hcy-binding domain-containing protein [Caenorhabditis elegans]|eukprot:NP_508223.2 Uncharacterized protein CELE_T13G4.4 [Caenorhabditis elegans]
MVRLLDGSMSSQLLRFGYDCNQQENKPHWSFPANADMELMENVYKSFLDLEVKVITSNTYHFGSTLDKTIPENAEKRELYEKYFEETCLKLCHLTTGSSDVEAWGSVGTLATMYHDLSEYTGAYMDQSEAKKTAYDYFKIILTLFHNRSSIRKLIFETIPSADEGSVALDVLQEFPEFEAVISFTFKEHGCLRHGEKITSVAQQMKQSPQVLGIGINCTDPNNVLPALNELQPFAFSEVFVYPNKGDSKFLEEGIDESNVFTKTLVTSWIEKGVTAIGGCCGVTNDQIKVLKPLLGKINTNQLL